jgi:hypothetical protein
MSTLRLTTISNQDGSATVPSQTVISGSAKAWVNFNGTGTVAIRASFNVTSITDNGTGDYTVNFTVAMVDANYAAFVSAEQTGFSFTPTSTSIISIATSNVRVAVAQGASGLDRSIVCVSVFR